MTATPEYPALLAQLAPEQAVHVFNDRVALIKQVNSSVADWLQERRRVEDAYVQGLRKLASRPQHDGGAALGIFQIPWQRIVSGTENLAASHEILAQKIESDVEGPLRRFNSSDAQIKAATSSQGNLSAIARNLESAQKRAAKGGRKAEDAGSSVDEASRSWESQAPYIFEQLQALDEHRINHLRDVLTQLQTHELDQVERTRTSAESCLNALLNVETADEIKRFASKAAATAAATPAPERREILPRRRSSAAASTRPASSSTSTNIPPAAPPPRLSQRNPPPAPSAASHDIAAHEQPTPPHKSKLGGLKRLGTVIKGRKSHVPPPPPLAEKREKKTRPFSTFRRGDSSQSFQDLENTGQDLPRSNTDDNRNALTQVQSTVTETEEEITPPAGSPQRPDNSARDGTVNGTLDSRQSVGAVGVGAAGVGAAGVGAAGVGAAGVGAAGVGAAGVGAAGVGAAGVGAAGVGAAGVGAAGVAGVAGVAGLAAAGAAAGAAFYSAHSGEGPSDESTTPQPTAAQRENLPTHEAPATVSPTSTQHQQHQLQLQNQQQYQQPPQQDPWATSTDSEEGARNFAIRDQPIHEDEGAANLAISSMAQQLRVQAESSGVNRSQGTVRGRRDVRNTVFVPSGVDGAAVLAAGGAAVGALGVAGATAAASPSAQSTSSITPASPIPRAPLRPVHEDMGVGSDTTSIHSAHSLIAQPHHPELHDPGLNASIVETVNSWFNESGIIKSFVTGEIALAYNNPSAGAGGASANPNADTEVIRLQHFELLEKVAANPVFISPPPKATTESASEESAGTYSVALSAIHRSTPLVGLKYQLHIDAASLSHYSPLLITPAWQLIEGQASIIVQYALNPVFLAGSTASATATPITLKNVIISVSLDHSNGPVAQSAVMSPQQGATFRRKTCSVIWRLPEFTVKPEEQSRLLVRFTTPGIAAKKGSIEVKFDLPGRAGSQIGVLQRKASTPKNSVEEKDPFADDGGADRHSEETDVTETWEEVSTKRSLVSGRYTAA